MTNTLMYVAGWSLPGCLPEMEPALFDSYEDAQAWLDEQAADVHWDLPADYEDPYIYWIDVFVSQD
jgi:hypothetical protein